LGMPFNSPFNDYMMAIDELNGVGWFASDRYQPKDKVVVYLFIVNQEKVILRSNDESYLRNMAKISNIKSTQNGKNYTELLSRIYRQKEDKKQAGEFQFIVADNLIYTQLTDFQSFEAKSYFIKAREIEQQLKESQALLNAKRSEYILSMSLQKEILSDEILKLEKEILLLINQPNNLYMKARNEEILYLKQK